MGFVHGGDGRRMRRVSDEDRFRFECKRCARCCFGSEFALTPYDVLRLCERLNVTTRKFLFHYGQAVVEVETGLPTLWLDFGKAQRRLGADEGAAVCPFLDLRGDQFLCRVYAFRPTRCRAYPLFRVAVPGREPRHYLRKVECPAAETTEEHTVRGWIEHEGLPPYFWENERFFAWKRRLTETRREWPEPFLELLAMLWYNYSVVRKGETLREKYGHGMRGAALLADAMVKLYRMKEERDEMKVEAVNPGELMEELEGLVERRRRDKYSLQVKLEDVEFTFDEEGASTDLEVDSEMSPIEEAELYLREGFLEPVRFVESDGTVHQILEWDPTPVGYSGFVDCVTHSIVVTDRGTFEVGRYPAMNVETFGKVWQWFIHRKIEGGERD